MNKTLFVLISIFIILLSTIFIVLNNSINTEKNILQYNSYYTNYLDKIFFGSEVATIISKAIDNNEKHNIEKDNNGLYIPDGEYSIKMYINILGSNKTYEMETINKVGISQFISNFNVMKFTCYEIKFHESTNRISEMYIKEIVEE